MAFEKFEFTKSWENMQDFPTYEPSEAQVRADLQLLHNETRDGLNRLVDALNDPTAAAQLPFQAEQGMKADNVQDAILEAYGAVQSAAAGQIVNGSITKEKLNSELLQRVYGGRPWVSMDTPGAAQTPETDFPVGQIWLRPTFTVKNLAGTAWSASAATVTAVENGWRLTGSGTMATISAGQSLTNLGTEGQKIFVSLRTSAVDIQLTGITLYLNGKACDLADGGGVFEAALNSQGGLEATVMAQWPAASLATGSVTLTHWAVVNAAQIEGQQEDCAPLTDWPALLTELVPFQSCRLGREVYLQTAPGQWELVSEEVLAVERGGTGRNAVSAGQLLYGTGSGALEALDAPKTEGSMLCFSGGKPAWNQKTQVIQALGSLRMMTGGYTGTGETQTITLPVSPVLLLIFREIDPTSRPMSASASDNILILGDGTITVDQFTGMDNRDASVPYLCSVALVGSTLTLRKYSAYTLVSSQKGYGNEKDVPYRWVAVY